MGETVEKEMRVELKFEFLEPDEEKRICPIRVSEQITVGREQPLCNFPVRCGLIEVSIETMGFLDQMLIHHPCCTEYGEKGNGDYSYIVLTYRVEPRIRVL